MYRCLDVIFSLYGFLENIKKKERKKVWCRTKKIIIRVIRRMMLSIVAKKAI